MNDLRKWLSLLEDGHAALATRSPGVTDTPAFRAWFGDSKVVDDSGSPLPMYHGTQRTFTEFMTGSHFGDIEAANTRLASRMRDRLHPDRFAGHRGVVLPVYLAIENPLRIVDKGGLEDGYDFAKEALQAGAISDAEYQTVSDHHSGMIVTRRLFALLATRGYDGLVYRNTVEGNADSWVPFRANQVKSVFNRGSFSPDSNHISEAREPAGNLLLELDWYDRSPLTAVLRRNRGRYIHFTNGAPNRFVAPQHVVPAPDDPRGGGYDHRTKMKQYQRDLRRATRMTAAEPVPKLGVNPIPGLTQAARSARRVFPSHRDPMGIYFYPVNFILSGHENIRAGSQNGLDMRYYYVCDLKLDTRGINLQFVRWPEIEALAERNGWADDLDAFRALPLDQQQNVLPSNATANVPGSVLWHFVETLVNAGKITWNAAFRGVSYIKDPGLSIIHAHEPDQVLVLDPRIIAIVESGENPPKGFIHRDLAEYWDHAIVAILKTIRGELGGDLTWAKKCPTLRFTAGMAIFDITAPDRSRGGSDTMLSITYRYGRATGYERISLQQMEKQSEQQITDEVVKLARKIGRRKTDLLFTPVISEATARRVLSQQVSDHPDLTWEPTQITNDAGKYNKMVVGGAVHSTPGNVAIETRQFCDVSPAGLVLSAYVLVNGKALFGSRGGEVHGDDIARAMASLAVELAKSLRDNMQRYRPGQSGQYRRHAIFREDADFQAAHGWLALHCGLSLDGLLAAQMDREIAAYQAYPEKDWLVSDIRHVLRE